MKLGLLGGSFDPVHYGHLSIAEEALAKFDLNRVEFILAKQNPLKLQSPSSDILRIQALEAALKDYPQFGISTWELDNSITYTYQTIEHYVAKHPKDELFWIMGLDSWLSITQWKHYEYLLETLIFIVFDREGFEFSDQGLNARVHFVPGANYPISSSQLRGI